MLKVTNITSIHEEETILDKINLEINPGEVHAILGPKHSGKTALVHAITGHPEIEITDGDITWCGKDLTILDTDDRVKKNIFIGFQNPSEFEDFTNWELAKLIFQPKYPDPEILHLRYFVYCNLLGLGKEHLTRYVDDRSMTLGQAKKNEILHMLMSEPELIILDEIEQGLDDDDVELVGNLINGYLKDGDRSCLLVTHSSKLLDILIPSHVHVMTSGKLQTMDDADIYKRIVEDGYSELS